VIENHRELAGEATQGGPIMIDYRITLAVTSLGLFMSGCANMNNTQSGALAGTGLGAVTGAIIGEAAGGRPGAGALIGAATGAVAGGLVGNAEDAKEERDVAVAHAQYEHARNQAIAQAVTESDVIVMTRNNVGDDVIINSLRTRGCRWDSSPDAVIRLKHEGVSDRVIQAMQNTGVRPVVAGGGPPPPAYYYPPPPPPVGGVVIVGPGYYGPHYGPRYYGRPYYRRW